MARVHHVHNGKLYDAIGQRDVQFHGVVDVACPAVSRRPGRRAAAASENFSVRQYRNPQFDASMLCFTSCCASRPCAPSAATSQSSARLNQRKARSRPTSS